MTADSYLEMVLVLMGCLINNALWMIITTTGIFAIPLAFRIAGVWLKVREEGDDEGNKGALALPRMEHVIYVAFVVIMFCAMPMQDVDITTMKFDRTRSAQCGVNVPKPDESGYGPLIAEFNGQTAKIPAWWYLVHSLSKGVTHAAIASIPCGNDFRLLRFEVQHTKLIDPITCHLYQNEQREGRFQKLSGYLVLASKVYDSDNNPGDNPLLIVI